MLLLNHKMAATEAWENGLVMEVLKPGNFMEQVDSRVKAMAAMPSKVSFINSSQRSVEWYKCTSWNEVLPRGGRTMGLDILRDDVLGLFLPWH